MSGTTHGMDLKGFGPFEIKDESTGEVTAVVNTLGIVDRDRDVILPGAIPDGSVVKMSFYNHDVILQSAPPVGRGVVNIEGDRAVFRGKFYLNTEKGREAFELVKAEAEDGEWSIGFRNVKTAELTDEWKAKGARRVIAGLDLMEVSPVFIGANPKTRTLAVKAADSLTDQVEAVNAALYARNDALPEERRAEEGWYAVEVFEDSVIVRAYDGTMYRVAYTTDEDGAVTLGEVVRVEVEYRPVEKSASEEGEPKEGEGEGTEAKADAVEQPEPEEDPAEVAARIAAELEEKRAAEAEAEAERVAAELKAQASEEFERFQRTLRRLGRVA